ncbi:hypothetical protein PPL_00410 [Heterostelium album PN500]|uniref:Kelch motif family protein n=1 Tax=Heterostelium pallidum (strain ATCC 26659 / Pp 5 / PN500) TaxID=670386 RepID=D3AWD6_HETP5|nr:hypothetical protein PPL_00410 [Heterostelium album PN500]EFA86609.1 hypothetical protein PPL_00410 [Heterostelium album PN500]|eukprot:XP_020438714.1 hypothetical protein PPL_00410 [Heterostelium album PN500]
MDIIYGHILEKNELDKHQQIISKSMVSSLKDVLSKKRHFIKSSKKNKDIINNETKENSRNNINGNNITTPITSTEPTPVQQSSTTFSKKLIHKDKVILSNSPIVQPRKQSLFIFSLDIVGGITLINIADKSYHSLDNLKSIGKFSLYSTVNTGDAIYVFGGYDRSINKFMRISLTSFPMTVDFQDDIPTLKNFAQFRSVCYDGDHIYMIGYNDSGSHRPDTQSEQQLYYPGNMRKLNSRIDVFNIKTMEFKALVRFKEEVQFDNRIILLSFIFRDCIYMDRFFKMNLTRKTVTELQEFDYEITNFYSLVYHTINDNLHVIYLIGGKTLGNHTYVIELNLWRSFAYDTPTTAYSFTILTNQ